MRSEHLVVTPESVEFVYELAGLGSRLVAAAVDHVILMVALALVVLVTCSVGVLTSSLGGGALPLVAAFTVYFGYFAYFEWRWNGQTPGKRLADVRVIDDRGMNIELSQSLIRNLFRLVDMMPMLFALDYVSLGFYGIGGLSALLSPQHKRLGDWAAGTLVVRTRKRILPSAVLPPHEKYNSLQEDAALRARLRRELTLEERETLLQLCLRRSELEFEARQNLFREAALFLTDRLHVERPAFLSEEKFVQNIAALALAEGGSGGWSRRGGTEATSQRRQR